VITLREEKNEKNKCGSSYNILYSLDKVFEYVGEHPDEEDMHDDVNEEYIEPILMKCQVLMKLDFIMS